LNNTNVGAATANASWAGDANHTGNIGAGGFAIAQASSTVTVSCPASLVSTGSPLTPCTASATGVAMAPVDVTASIVYSNNITGPTATAVATWAGDVNHTGSSGSGSFLITAPPPSAITIDPIPNRSDRLGAEVEFQVVVRGAGRGGNFSAMGLPNGIRINADGEIHGHVGGPAHGPLPVTVSFTKDGVTVSTTFLWEVTQPKPHTDDDKDGNDNKEGDYDR
jgi:hypothetical protein